jgi:hypothetical protein
MARTTLHREHRGVYRVGHRAPLPFSREMAAVLAAGPRAVVSHVSAGYLWALTPAPKDGVDLTGRGAPAARACGCTGRRSSPPRSPAAAGSP